MCTVNCSNSLNKNATIFISGFINMEILKQDHGYTIIKIALG